MKCKNALCAAKESGMSPDPAMQRVMKSLETEIQSITGITINIRKYSETLEDVIIEYERNEKKLREKVFETIKKLKETKVTKEQEEAFEMENHNEKECNGEKHEE